MDKAKAIQLTLQAAAKSACHKRKVGALIVDKTGFRYFTGHNYNTKDGPCEVDGVTVDTVMHAEVAAIEAYTADQGYSPKEGTLYVTHTPCSNCQDLIDTLKLKVVKVEEFLKFDKDKLRYDLIPPETLKALATVLTHGAKKYKPDNWKRGETNRYTSAMFRHFEAWRAGEKLDPDSGEPHLAHALTNLMFIHFLDIKDN